MRQGFHALTDARTQLAPAEGLKRELTQMLQPGFVFLTAILSFFTYFSLHAAVLTKAKDEKPKAVSPAAPMSLDELSFSVPGTGSLQSVFSPPEEGSDEGFHASGNIAFAKLVLVFQAPLHADAVTLESCGDAFKDGVELAFYPGVRRVFGEGGAAKIRIPLGSEQSEIQTVAIEFRHNSGYCLKSIYFSKNGERLQIRPPKGEKSIRVLQASERSGRLARFQVVGLDGVLDQELTPRSDDERWIFRFRGDGSFFIYGHADDPRFGSRFSALGRFTILESSKNHLKLELSGKRITTAQAWDGWICLDSCTSFRNTGHVEKVADTLEIERLPVGGLMIRNRVPPKNRTLPFSDLRVRPTLP